LYISGTSKGKIQKDGGKKKQDEVEIQEVLKKDPLMGIMRYEMF